MCYFCLSLFLHTPVRFFTWKRELWPCSRAGLRGATGLKLLQKWMPDSSGLWASSKPEGVCDGRGGDTEGVNERNEWRWDFITCWNGKWTRTGVWKNKLTEQEGSLWFLLQNAGVTWGGKEEVDSGGCCWFGVRNGEWGEVLTHLESKLERKHMKSISASLSLSPGLLSPSPRLSPVSPQRSEPVLWRDPALRSLLMELLEHMASLRASSPLS